MKISVVIPTRNRPQELLECIRSIMVQSVFPDELIIVDTSDTENAYSKIRSALPKEKLKYIHANLSITSADHQRNIGVGNSSGDIIFFLDDDMVLDKDFIKEIVKVFKGDSEKKIGGVMGNIVNVQRHSNIKTNLLLLFQRIFLLTGFGDGRFRSSGCPTFVHGIAEIKNVEFLSGGLTAYRREVFKDFRFDEDFRNAMFTDDEDFSCRVSRKYQNVYTPYAKIVHNPSRIGRIDRRIKAKMTVEARYYLLKKNFSRTLKHTVAFWWSVIGYLLQAIMTGDRESIKGTIDGIHNIKEIASTYVQ